MLKELWGKGNVIHEVHASFLFSPSKQVSIPLVSASFFALSLASFEKFATLRHHRPLLITTRTQGHLSQT